VGLEGLLDESFFSGLKSLTRSTSQVQPQRSLFPFSVDWSGRNWNVYPRVVYSVSFILVSDERRLLLECLPSSAPAIFFLVWRASFPLHARRFSFVLYIAS